MMLLGKPVIFSGRYSRNRGGGPGGSGWRTSAGGEKGANEEGETALGSKGGRKSFLPELDNRRR
jgi:hypothetical protein